MLGSLRLARAWMVAVARGQIQKRSAFALTTVGTILLTLTDFVGIWTLLARFGNIRGWSALEVALFYALVQLGYALGHAAGRGFEDFGDLVRSGAFDRVLLRPRPTALQILLGDIDPSRLLRAVVPLGVLVWSTRTLGIEWSLAHTFVMVFAVLGGGCLFLGIHVVQATVAFWSVESLEVFNILTYGGVAAGQYPLDIYTRGFRRFFTYVVPLAAVGYLPAHVLLGKEALLGLPSAVLGGTPLLAVVFLALALLFWSVGVRHYRSTGS